VVVLIRRGRHIGPVFTITMTIYQLILWNFLASYSYNSPGAGARKDPDQGQVPTPGRRSRVRLILFGRSRPGARTLAITAAAAVLCAPAIATATASAATISTPTALASSDWHQAVLPANYYVGNGQNGAAISPVSCVRGTLFCLAVTAYLPPGLNGPIPQGVVITTDGGVHWRGFASLNSGPDVTAVSCPSTSVCWIAGYNDSTGAPEIAESTNAGKTWIDKTPASLSSTSQQLNALDCVSGSVCWVAGDDQTSGVAPLAAETTDGGSTWKTFTNLPTFAPYDPNGTYQLNAISCITALDCVAGGGLNYSDGLAQVISTTDGGQTWNLSTDPTLSGLQQIFSLSCLPTPAATSSAATSSAATCMAAGDELAAAGPVVVRSTDGGATWSGLQSFDTTGWMSSVSCANASHCWAAGAGTTVGLAGTSDAGASWSVLDADTSNIDGLVSCASLTLCIATTDNALWVTKDFGGIGSS
jgi:hypothetical protein